MQKVKSMIEEIHFGRRGLWENYKTTPEAQKYLDRFCKMEQEYKQKLTEEQAKELNDLLDALESCHTEEIISRFKDGFKIGMRLAFESFEEPE